MNQIDAHFLQFFSDHILKEKNVLLGLSGGSDSTSLFYLLLEHQVRFGAAHVNHGWRVESLEEADALRSLCQSHQIPFYYRQLDAPSGNNLEEQGRKERYAFFKKICNEEGYEGVILGHHADDQAETVLKRIFEGATLRRLKGLSTETLFQDLKVWRPLLPFRKKDILEWLQAKEISFFEDVTNVDRRFLRSRMRTTLLPYLSLHFGKEISSSLCRLGRAAEELDEFLEHLVRPYRELHFSNEKEKGIDLSVETPATRFEWRVVVHDFFEKHKITVSSSLLDTMITHLLKKNVNKCIRVGKQEVRLHRGILFLSDCLNSDQPTS